MRGDSIGILWLEEGKAGRLGIRQLLSSQSRGQEKNYEHWVVQTICKLTAHSKLAWCTPRLHSLLRYDYPKRSEATDQFSRNAKFVALSGPFICVSVRTSLLWNDKFWRNYNNHSTFLVGLSDEIQDKLVCWGDFTTGYIWAFFKLRSAEIWILCVPVFGVRIIVSKITDV